MSEPMKQAWSDVADGFSTLGRMMKERYRDADDAETGEASAGPAARPRDASGALREAFDQLMVAGRELGERAGDVARDDDVKAQAKEAATSLNDALAATVELIGAQVGGLFKRGGGDEPTPEVAASEPPADDVRQ